MPYVDGVYEQYYQKSVRVQTPLPALLDAFRGYVRSYLRGWSTQIALQPDSKGGWLAQVGRPPETVPVVPNDLMSRMRSGFDGFQGRRTRTVPISYEYSVRFMFQPEPGGAVVVSHMTIETIDRERRFGDSIGSGQEVPAMPGELGGAGRAFLEMISARI